jgi:hypothetical protein
MLANCARVVFANLHQLGSLIRNSHAADGTAKVEALYPGGEAGGPRAGHGYPAYTPGSYCTRDWLICFQSMAEGPGGIGAQLFAG